MGTPLLGIRKWIPAILFACGVLLIAAAVAAGEAEVSLVVIFPVFTGSSWMFVSGVLLIIAGFVVFFLTMFGAIARDTPGTEPEPVEGDLKEQTGTHYGGLVLIGPVPIVFGSDRKTAMIMLTIGIVLVAVFVGLLLTTLLLG